jgi:drug/metabolite transporter (DMT)-like permease
VTAILGGLGAAVMWATATILASRSSRLIGPFSVLAWVMLTGLVVTLPFVVASGVPSNLDGGSVAWLAVSGLGNVGGLLFEYAALRVGKVGIIAPIASTEGAIAAVLAVVAGESLTGAAAATLALIAGGVALASIAREDVHAEPTERHETRATVLAIGAALAFGFSLYATGRVSGSLPIAWALLPARVVGVVGVLLPLLATRRLRLTRPALPLVVGGGLCEVIGFASFALGARHGIAVSAVLASQFAALSALAAYVLFRERLQRIQLVGVTAIVAGVALLTVIQSS